jgi:CDP-diacylglycerol--serine O-phosphatidyltransferase
MAARFTGGTSRFGLEYDSMADLVSFGLAPSLLMFQWHLARYHRVGWAAAFLFMACGALRLARFNVQSGDVQKFRFLGIPIPMAASQVVTTYLILVELKTPPRQAGIIVMVTAYVIAFLMISNCPYRSLKGIQVPRRYSFYVPVLFILTAAILWIFPQIGLWIISTSYILSGPVELFIRRVIMRRPPETPPTPAQNPKDRIGELP